MAEDIEREKAYDPEDIPRLFVAFAQAGDFAGLATLYENDAILALPPGAATIGSQAIAAVFAERLGGQQSFDNTGSKLLPVLRCGDLALTSTRMPDGRTTTEVARQQADGSWRWVIDQPNAQV
jgi:ketosteroid isomerase-like protein